jgi:transposase
VLSLGRFKDKPGFALSRWLAYCADTDIPELTRLARTIDSWHAEFLAYFDTGGVQRTDRSSRACC